MRIAILYICTGRYTIFWDTFFRSCEKYFIPSAQKEYFVFTDATKIEYESQEHVHKIFQKKLGWPYDTLMRFHIFSSINDQLKEFDYIFFFNANILFVRTITAEEFLPNNYVEGGLAVLHHPGYYNKSKAIFPYEQTHEKSMAYIEAEKGAHYFMGSLNGGTFKAYLQLIEHLHKNIQIDLDKNIIAIWHDESHLNKYLLNKNPKILSPAYGYPEGWKIPFKPKIIIRDKDKYGGHDFLRGKKKSLSFKNYYKIVKRKIFNR